MMKLSNNPTVSRIMRKLLIFLKLKEGFILALRRKKNLICKGKSNFQLESLLFIIERRFP